MNVELPRLKGLSELSVKAALAGLAANMAKAVSGINLNCRELVPLLDPLPVSCLVQSQVGLQYNGRVFVAGLSRIWRRNPPSET